MEALHCLLVLTSAGGFVTLTAILFTLWDIRVELRILNARKRD